MRGDNKNIIEGGGEGGGAGKFNRDTTKIRQSP